MKPRFTGTEKECIRCHRTLPIDDFYKAKRNGIYSSRCKQCDNTFHRERFSASYQKRAIILCHSAKSRSKRRGIPFSITTQDIIRQYETQHGKCYYSGRPLTPVPNDDNVMSIDRITPDVGYTPENIVICCWKINRMKNDESTQNFLALCTDICHFSEANGSK